MPWQVPITVDGLEYPVTFNTEEQPTQQDLDEAVQQILSQRGQAPQPVGETPGYLSQLGSALGLGYRQMKSGVGATFNALTGDNADVAAEMAEQANLQREQQAMQSPEDAEFMRRLDEAESAYNRARGPFETIGALSQYPAAALAEPGAAFKTAVQSAPNALISGATSLAGYGLGGIIGGAAGIETGPGAILTGIAGAAAGGALSNTLMEAGPAIFDVLNEKTQGQAMNMTADQISSFLRENPDVINEGLKTGVIRGSVIGAIEALGVKGSGRLLTMPERAAARAAQKKLVEAGVDVASKEAVEMALLNPSLREATKAAADAAKSQFSSAGNLARMAGASAIETGAAGVGELAAQAAAGQEISMKDAFLESLGEIALAAPMAAGTKMVEGGKYLLPSSLRGETQAEQPVEEQPSMPLPDEIVIAADNLKATENVPFTDVSGKTTAAIIEQNNQIAPQPTIQPEQAAEEVGAKVAPETPSLPETGPPVVDQEAPAGTPVQAAPIQPENLQSALDAHTSGPKTPEQDWQFAVSMPEGVWIEDGLGGRMRKKIHRIKSSGSEEIEFEHQVFNEETGKWEDNPSAYAFMSKKKDGSLAVNNRFPSPLQPASYTEISTGERKISKPIVVLSSPQPVEAQEDAIQEQIPDEGVLRQERPEVELQGVGEGNVQPEEIAGKGEVQEEVISSPKRQVVESVFNAIQSHLANGGDFQIPGNPPLRITKKNANQFSVSSDGDLMFKRGKKGGIIPITDVAVIGSQVGSPFDVLSLFEEAQTERPKVSESLAIAESDNGASFDRLSTLIGDRHKAADEIETLTGKDVFSVWPVVVDAVADSVSVSNGQFVDTDAKAEKLRSLYREAQEMPASKERADAIEQITLASNINQSNRDSIKRKKITPPIEPTTATEGMVTPGGVATERDLTKPEQMTPEESYEAYTTAKELAPNLADMPKTKKQIREGIAIAENSGIKDPELQKMFMDSAKAETAQFAGPYIRVQRIRLIEEALEEQKPVSTAAVDTYGITLPEGYVKQGDLYVFQPQTTAAETQTPESVGRGLGGSRGASSSLEGGRSSELPEVSLETESESSGNLPAVEQIDRLVQSGAKPEEMDKFVKSLTDDQFNELVASEAFDVDPKPAIKPKDNYDAKHIKRRKFVDAVNASTKEVRKTAQQVFQEEEAAAKKQEKLEQDTKSSLNSVVGPQKKNDIQGTVTKADVEAARAALTNSGEIPNAYLTNVYESREAFLADRVNSRLFPASYVRLQTEKNIEGLFENGQTLVFAKEVHVSDLDRGLAKMLGVSDEQAAARRVIAHENGHKAISLFTMAEKRELRGYLMRAYSDEQVENLVKTYTEYADWRTNPESRLEALEELLMRDFEKMDKIPTGGVWDDIVQFLKRVWRRLTGQKGEPKLKELKDVVRLMRNALKRPAVPLGIYTLKDGGQVKLSMIAPAAGITPEMDAEYLAAVQAGDMEKAQRMVDEAAKAAGVILESPNVGKSPILSASSNPDAKPFKFYQGFRYEPGKHPGFTYRKGAVKNLADRSIGFYLSGDREHAEEYSKKILKDDERIGETRSLYVKSKNPFKFYVENLTGRQLIETLERGGVKIPDDVRDRWTWVYTNGLSHESKIWKWINADHMNRGEVFNDSLRNAFIAAGYDSIIHPDSSGILWGLPEPVMAIAIFSPEQIKSADPVTRDDQGRIIPLSRRFDTGADIRFSRPQFSSDISAALTTGSEAARSTLYSERDMDIREAIRRAYEAMPKTNSVAVPIGELFAKTEELMPGVTQDEFSLVLQDLFEDNAAVLQEGDVVEPLTEKDRRYLALAEDEDANREELQRMVDEAAKAAGGLVFEHTSKSVSNLGDLEIDKTSKNSTLGKGVYGTLEGGSWKPTHLAGGITLRGFVFGRILDLTNPTTNDIEKFSELLGHNTEHVPLVSLERRFGDIGEGMRRAGFDAAIHLGPGSTGRHIAIFSTNKIKSANPVTRDDAGNIIPLSRRFDTGTDIRGQINVTTPEGRRAGFVVVMPSKSISVPLTLRSMAMSEPSRQPINQQKYDEAITAISNFLSGKQTIQFPGKLTLSSNARVGIRSGDSRITQGLGETARTTGGETGTGTAGGQSSDAQVQGVAQQGFGPYSVRDLVGEASRIGVADVRIDPESKHGAYTTVSESGEIYIGINPARMANRIAANDGDVQYAIGSILNEELIHAADMAVLREQWLTSGSKLTLAEFVKEQDVKTVREMIQVAKSSNDPVASTRILFDAITSSVNLYAGNDVTSLDSVETFLNAASHDEISAVMGEFVRQMIQTGLYQTVSEKTLFRKFIEKVKALARKIADVFAPAKEGRYGKLIKERLNGIEELLAYASTKTGAKASRIQAEGPAVSKLQEDVRNIDEGSVKKDFKGVQFTDTKPNQRTVKPKQSYTDAAVEFVDSLQSEGNSLEDIAYSIQSPDFIEGLGIERDLSMQDAIGLEVRNRINNALRKEKAPSVKARLSKLNESLSKFWQGIGSMKGQHLAIRQKLIADPRYRWMFIKDKAESAMKEARENVATANITSTDDLTNQMNREGEKADEQSGEQNTNKASDLADDILMEEGEALLNEENKGIWNSIKNWLRQLAILARIDAEDVKTGSKASKTENEEFYVQMKKLSKEERQKKRDEIQNNINKALKKLKGNLSEAERASVDGMVEIQKRRGPRTKGTETKADLEIKSIMREMNKARPGQKPPLSKQISWKQIFSQKAKTVEEYRQRIFDAISANKAFQNLSDEQKGRLSDLFSEAWESKRKDILERMLTNLINKEEAAKRISKDGAQALREQSQRLVEDINLGILDSDELMKRLAEKFGIKSEFTEEEKQKIDSLIDTLQDSTLNRVKRNKAAYDLLKTLSGTVKVPITKLLADLWVTNVLSGINTMTSIALAVSSGAFELTSGVLRIIKAAIANPKQLPSEISASFKSLARFLGAFPREANLAWQYLVTGDRAFLDPSMNDVLNDLSYDSIGKSVSLAERLAESDKLLEKTVGVWMRTVSRLLAALDSFNSGVTKSGAIPIVARQLELDPATLAKAEESMNLQNYKDRIIQRDFAGVAPKTARERALVDSWAKDEMMADLDKYGEFTENADFFGQQGAMTLDPSGIGGMIYRLIKSVTGNLSAGSDRFLAESQRKWQESGKNDSVASTRLALAYALQFIAYNSANLAGLRFARFAGNKFNQGLSFIPGIGMLRIFEADLDKTHVKGKEAFMDMIQRNQFAGVMMTMVGLAILKAIADEPDDEKRGWSFNGGWANLTPERKQQKLAAGEKEYTIRVGDKVFNYQNWPISSVLAAIGGLSDLIRYSPEQWNEKSIVGRLGSAAASGVFAASEIPALSQFQELFGSNLSSKDPNEKKLDRFSRVMAGWGGGFVPRILKDFDYLAEPTLKKYDTLWERTASHIPVYRRYIGDDYYDILGKPIERKIYPGSREFMEKPSAPEYQVLGKLNSRGIWLTPANAEHRMVGKGRNRRRLTQEEADAYSLETGKGYRQMLLRYGQRALQMPTERARAFLSDKADEVRDRALKKVYRGYK